MRRDGSRGSARIGPLRLNGPAPHRDGARSRGAAAAAEDRCPDEIRRHGGTNDEDPPVGGDPYYHYQGHHLPAYVGLPAFQKLPVMDDETLASERPDVAIVSAPYDEGTSRRPGSRFGPDAIRAATYHAGSVNSLQLGIQPFDWLACADAGDAPIVPGNPERAHDVIRRKVGVVMQAGAVPIVLGGDHSVTWPAAAAVAEGIAPQSTGIVHFDAHADAAATVGLAAVAARRCDG